MLQTKDALVHELLRLLHINAFFSIHAHLHEALATTTYHLFFSKPAALSLRGTHAC